MNQTPARDTQGSAAAGLALAALILLSAGYVLGGAFGTLLLLVGIALLLAAAWKAV